MRVFAVQIDDDLFDAITERVKELGTTKRGYIESLTLKELRESHLRLIPVFFILLI